MRRTSKIRRHQYCWLPSCHTASLSCLVAAAAVAVGTAGAWADSKWQRFAPMPVGQQEIYADVRDGKIYTAGGLSNGAKVVSKQVFVYDPDQDIWSNLAPMPEPRHHVTVSIVGDQLFGIGGFVGGFPNWRATNSVFVYDFGSKKWAAGPSLPSARGEHVSAVVDGKIFVIGGRVRASKDASTFEAHHDTSRADVFNPKTGNWRRVADAPTERNSAAGVVVNGLIYVIGGRQFRLQPDGKRRSVNLATLEVYDPATNRWTKRRPMPQAQGGLSAAALDGNIYVFGGEQWVPAKKVLKQAWLYDPARDEWRALPPMLTARHGTAAATVDRRVFVFGGATVTGAGEVDINESLTVPQ